MKLLAPSAVKSIKTQEFERDLLRTKELNIESDKARKNLANAQADFNQMLAGQRLRLAQEEEEHAKRTTEMTREIGILEDRKQKALEPVILIEERAKIELQNAQEASKSAIRREEEADELSDLLQDKLDAVGAREQDVIKEEQSQQVAREAIITQQEMLKHQYEILNKSLTEFSVENAKNQESFKRTKDALYMQELSLNAKEDRLNQKEQELAVFKRQLDDRQKTIERTLKRLNIPI